MADCFQSFPLGFLLKWPQTDLFCSSPWWRQSWPCRGEESAHPRWEGGWPAASESCSSGCSSAPRPSSRPPSFCLGPARSSSPPAGPSARSLSTESCGGERADVEPKPSCRGKGEVLAERYPAPDRAVETDGDCGGVLPISFPYGPADGGVGEDRMLVFPPMASSESTERTKKRD